MAEYITVRCWSCRTHLTIPLETARATMLHPCHCGKYTSLRVRHEDSLDTPAIYDVDSGATKGTGAYD